MGKTIAVAWCCALAAFAQSPATVIVVRHAERASAAMGNDVGISEAGACRAEKLAGMLADAGVTAIFTSEVARTRQTAAPIARKLRLVPQVVPAADTALLVEKLRAAKGTVLVVGHSNTVPEIVRQLGAPPVGPLADTDYDRMFIVTGARVLTLHYAGCAQ